MNWHMVGSLSGIGDYTPIETGHMSGNPLVHMGGFSLIVFALIGFAWGMMPVRPWNFRHRRWGDAFVSVAGPAMNLLIAFVTLTSLGIWIGLDPTMLQHGQPVWKEHVSSFLQLGGFLNLVLFALNLLPVPPLDGSRILSAFSATIRGWYQHPNAGMAGMVLFFLLLTTNAFDWVVLLLGTAAVRYTAVIASIF